MAPVSTTAWWMALTEAAAGRHPHRPAPLGQDHVVAARVSYLERDVRAITAVRDLATFRRFLSLVASRVGQVLNKTDLAAPLGVSVPTITSWLAILETTGQVLLVPPYFENFGKRLIKAPKLHLVDSGLACHLLGIDTELALRRSPFFGAIFEGFVASEIAKHQINSGRRREIYHFRDEQGLEVDLVVPAGDRRLVLIDAKASRTLTPRMAAPLVRLGRSVGDRLLTALVVHPRNWIDQGCELGSMPPLGQRCESHGHAITARTGRRGCLGRSYRVVDLAAPAPTGAGQRCRYLEEGRGMPPRPGPRIPRACAELPLPS